MAGPGSSEDIILPALEESLRAVQSQRETLAAFAASLRVPEGNHNPLLGEADLDEVVRGQLDAFVERRTAELVTFAEDLLIPGPSRYIPLQRVP